MRIESLRGVTLIELIILIAIGSFIVGGTVLFTRQITLNANQARDRFAAMDVGRLHMENVARTPFADLTEGDTDFDINNFSVRQSVSLTGIGSRTLTEWNTWIGGNLSEPDGDTFDYSLVRVDILVDEQGGDFSTPLLQLSTFRQSHVLQD